MKNALLLLLLCASTLAAKPMTPAEKARAARVHLTASLTGADLERIHVGNQAGILRIVAPDHHTVRFLKGTAASDVAGIDGEKWAPLSPTDRDSILAALDITPSQAEAVTRKLIADYAKLPKLETVALLGVLDGPSVVLFLEKRVLSSDPGPVRRQAVLALALIPHCGTEALPDILKFLQRDRNGWDTFTTVQFFEYHRDELQALPNLERIKAAVTASDNPHAEEILRRLAPVETPTPLP